MRKKKKRVERCKYCVHYRKRTITCGLDNTIIVPQWDACHRFFHIKDQPDGTAEATA